MRKLFAVVITGVVAAGIALAAAAPASAIDADDALNTNVLGITGQDGPVDIL